MTDVTQAMPQHVPQHAPMRQGSDYASRQAARRREYLAYFAVIFLCALPLALLVWALGAARRMAWPETGPIRAAWSQANIITPMILSA